MAIRGDDGVAARVAEAVRAESWLVVDARSSRGKPHADLVVTRRPDGATVVGVYGAPVRAAPCFVGPDASALRERGRSFRVPDADTVALARILAALPPGEKASRLFAVILQRSDHVDSLTPLRGGLYGADLRGSHLRRIRIQRIGVPVTRSHVHLVRIDLAADVDRAESLTWLRAAPGIRVHAGADGFPDTAAVEEYFRDSGSRRGDHSDVFVWEETVLSDGAGLCLTAAVDPNATTIPEILDALRLLSGRVRAERPRTSRRTS